MRTGSIIAPFMASGELQVREKLTQVRARIDITRANDRVDHGCTETRVAHAIEVVN
ncbi:protein of unknown function [Hyphomicrobium sp. MC1]|nr:protein of unknown function [Hyphomicrobium sp. MC1]